MDGTVIIFGNAIIAGSNRGGDPLIIKDSHSWLLTTNNHRHIVVFPYSPSCCPDPTELVGNPQFKCGLRRWDVKTFPVKAWVEEQSAHIKGDGVESSGGLYQNLFLPKKLYTLRARFKHTSSSSYKIAYFNGSSWNNQVATGLDQELEMTFDDSVQAILIGIDNDPLFDGYIDYVSLKEV